MTIQVSRRSLLALGGGLGATTMFGGRALARAPKLDTQPSYFYRFNLGDAQITVVSDGPLPLGPPKGTFTGASDDEISAAIGAIWRKRGDRYSEIRTAQTAKLEKIEMSYIGG